MREPARDKERLENIKEACQIIVEQLKNETLNELTNNPIKFYGYVKLVEIIGEAVYKMTKDFKAEHPNRFTVHLASTLKLNYLEIPDSSNLL